MPPPPPPPPPPPAAAASEAASSSSSSYLSSSPSAPASTPSSGRGVSPMVRAVSVFTGLAFASIAYLLARHDDDGAEAQDQSSGCDDADAGVDVEASDTTLFAIPSSLSASPCGGGLLDEVPSSLLYLLLAAAVGVTVGYGCCFVLPNCFGIGVVAADDGFERYDEKDRDSVTIRVIDDEKWKGRKKGGRRVSAAEEGRDEEMG